MSEFTRSTKVITVGTLLAIGLVGCGGSKKQSPQEAASASASKAAQRQVEQQALQPEIEVTYPGNGSRELYFKPLASDVSGDYRDTMPILQFCYDGDLYEAPLGSNTQFENSPAQTTGAALDKVAAPECRDGVLDRNDDHGFNNPAAVYPQK